MFAFQAAIQQKFLDRLVIAGYSLSVCWGSYESSVLQKFQGFSIG